MSKLLEYRPKKDRTNYKLRDGDRVALREPVKIPGYFYDPDSPLAMPRGYWEIGHVLPGAEGVVVHARTPKVRQERGTSPYFANVDVCMPDGSKVRVRPYHYQLRRLP